MITKMLQEEGGNLFDSRSASLGHTLQGGIPSPIDRVRAARLSLKCMVFLEQHHNRLLAASAAAHGKHTLRTAPPESASVITVQTSEVAMVPVREMVSHADMVNRRGKTAWWHDVKHLEEELAGKPQFLGLGKVPETGKPARVFKH
jgi:6-phosphofructokinase 1